MHVGGHISGSTEFPRNLTEAVDIYRTVSTVQGTEFTDKYLAAGDEISEEAIQMDVREKANW